MKIAILATFFVSLWTNFASAQSLPKYAVVNVTTTTVNDWPWSKGPRNVESKSFIAVSETAPSTYLFFVCPQAEDKGCEQINETPISLSALSQLIESGVGITVHDLPVMADLEWGFALPTTRNFVRSPGPKLIEVLQASGNLPPIEAHTWGSSSGKLLAQQILFYAGARLMPARQQK